MRQLWLITAVMVVVGIALVLVSLFADLGPVFLIGGILLVWSGIVKVVVLRVWRTVLSSPPLPEPMRSGEKKGGAIGQQP